MVPAPRAGSIESVVADAIAWAAALQRRAAGTLANDAGAGSRRSTRVLRCAHEASWTWSASLVNTNLRRRPAVVAAATTVGEGRATRIGGATRFHPRGSCRRRCTPRTRCAACAAGRAGASFPATAPSGKAQAAAANHAPVWACRAENAQLRPAFLGRTSGTAAVGGASPCTRAAADRALAGGARVATTPRRVLGVCSARHEDS